MLQPVIKLEQYQAKLDLVSKQVLLSPESSMPLPNGLLSKSLKLLKPIEAASGIQSAQDFADGENSYRASLDVICQLQPTASGTASPRTAVEVAAATEGC